MCRLQHFISDLWKQGGACEPHHNLFSLIPRLLGALGASKFQQMSPCLRMSSFWAPSNRTRDSSHRWLLGHRSPRLSALRSVEVTKKTSGQRSRARLNEGARRPNPLRQTFATKSAGTRRPHNDANERNNRTRVAIWT